MDWTADSANKNPQFVRLSLQSWIPHYLWEHVNPSLASLGQIMSIKKQIQDQRSCIATAIQLCERFSFENVEVFIWASYRFPKMSESVLHDEIMKETRVYE